ncbi:MAG: MurR/RpiR family transcriptional regulator, partial [Anaerotignaceae bacterium]
DKLNKLELQIHETIVLEASQQKQLRISDAANLCGCSTSKISKYVKKLGFDNYKQYIDFLYNKEMPSKPHSSELDRLKNFLMDFDLSMVSDFITKIQSYEKIILFGYGPSFFCAQYFEYKLRGVTNQLVFSVPDEISAIRLIDEKSVLVTFSVTSQFKSFQPIFDFTKEKNGGTILITEEFNASLLNACDHVYALTNHLQPTHLRPYEKSRVLFFIFIEEIVFALMEQNQKIRNTSQLSNWN